MKPQHYNINMLAAIVQSKLKTKTSNYKYRVLRGGNHYVININEILAAEFGFQNVIKVNANDTQTLELPSYKPVLYHMNKCTK